MLLVFVALAQFPTKHRPAHTTASLEGLGPAADPELLQRGHNFFFGSSGGMVASNDGGVAFAATLALIVAIDKVRKELWKAHIDEFKRHIWPVIAA